jgi:hypothetical protein
LQIEVRHEFAGMRTPVLLVARQDFSDELIEPIEAAIRQWLDAAQPPTENARLSLDVTCSIADTPLLRLRDMSLPLSRWYGAAPVTTTVGPPAGRHGRQRGMARPRVTVSKRGAGS